MQTDPATPITVAYLPVEKCQQAHEALSKLLGPDFRFMLAVVPVGDWRKIDMIANLHPEIAKNIIQQLAGCSTILAEAVNRAKADQARHTHIPGDFGKS